MITFKMFSFSDNTKTLTEIQDDFNYIVQVKSLMLLIIKIYFSMD